MAGMSAKKATTLGARYTLACCFICALPGIAGLMILNSTIGEWPVVDATVVSTRVCSLGSSGSMNNVQKEPSYNITYNYTTLEGTTFTFETDYCLSPKPAQGETTQIIYNPENPSIIVEEPFLGIGLVAAKTATGVGFGIGSLAFCVAVFMCSRREPPANPGTYQQNTNTQYQQDAHVQNTNYNNAEYGRSSVPISGPAGDIPTPNTYNQNTYNNASGPAGDIPTPMATAAPLPPATVYNGGDSQASGPVTYYK
ncbi:unnamed protein product [Cylindrotheca closterium]|uniref:DUF3592 domain-containing protein n=1 Tax=Cylindrotheca closterium TaxID=2856 RepID=A0AAD2GBM4_9STRA|nr:unnamed protein product [Cylindrotheca closterium]